MSRKMDWADKEARKLADALGIDSDRKTERALIAAQLRLTHNQGVVAGLDRAKQLVASEEKTDATS